MAMQTKITIETDSLLILQGQRSLRAWCPECGSQIEMIPLDGVGVISNLTPPEVEHESRRKICITRRASITLC